MLKFETLHELGYESKENTIRIHPDYVLLFHSMRQMFDLHYCRESSYGDIHIGSLIAYNINLKQFFAFLLFLDTLD